ncbi:hydantoinase/oxoprolinase family protein [Paraburkholderia sp. Ac-20336]|uniref:hydantoinase/oxoprolinase family protein n=1 Tax=Paraburkholderia sp. Ac-20336 TaxID=2703886 RepID=UPI00197DB449|nr:hydantoinase/oxoprolinase family protein [Paraburkholderia sp. Ac-20336]MBN3801472.1 hydantoinase/oxoprolinase family protein [Paraburkholderia sp. Ac-20336]
MTTTVGIDVGGTFTDLVLIDDSTGDVRLAKVPSTLDNQARGVLQALEQTGVALDTISSIVHGTTTTTNAVLERKLAKVGLITTRGFRDVLELGRRTRPTAYGLRGNFVPLVARNLRVEVDERCDASGNVVTPLDERQFIEAMNRLVEQGAESLLIHFLHAYSNPGHEQRALELAAEHWPNEYVTAGHQITAEFREYERGTAGAVNASVQPILDRYVRRLQDELQNAGFGTDLLVMQGNGGTVPARAVSRTAVNTVMSGPASGVMAAAHVSRVCGFPNLITYDMGGTSSDVALIEGGVPKVSSELELEYAMPIHVPMVDVHTVGAGGGSIARVNAGGILKVGPESAGSMPGPICYGRGGTLPTITDANLVLGRLNPDKLLSVDNKVSMDFVADCIRKEVAEPLGLSVHDAAAAILRVGNQNMANAIRLVSLARGYDPRDFALFGFGGAGPLHSTALARELGIPTVLIPVRPGLTNALGCLVADVRHDLVQSFNKPLGLIDDADLEASLAHQTAEGRQRIEKSGIAVFDIELRYTAEMQFQGQSHLLVVDILREQATRAELAEAFEKAYWQRFKVKLSELRPVLVSLNTSIVAKRYVPDLGTLAKAEPVASLADARVGIRPVWFEQGGWHDTPVFRRERLPECEFAGPAIVEQLDSTTVLEPGNTAKLDSAGNLIVKVAG